MLVKDLIDKSVIRLRLITMTETTADLAVIQGSTLWIDIIDVVSQK